MDPFDFDVGIIGGGPGGAATASYLAKAGLSCVLFEKELFPRPHVGESLVPSSTRVFKEIGFLEKMDQAGFPKKYGAAWTSEERRSMYEHGWEGLEPDCYADLRFEEREQPGVDRNYTFHVDRGKFDLMLLQHAQQLGATIYEGVRVQSVDFSMPSRPTRGRGRTVGTPCSWHRSSRCSSPPGRRPSSGGSGWQRPGRRPLPSRRGWP